jgi:glyoxylase-like metal-dependent hydrolase (beta-lactamase superfamily II)
MSFALHVLGAGAASARDLGASAAVIERDGRPLLLIDCGPDTLGRYLDSYGEPPEALYITHLHMDHVAGIEGLFYRLWFDAAWRGRTRVFVHAALVPLLQGRVADYPGALAEGGANFWEAFRLLPCTRGFWLEGLWFDLMPTRHHRPGTSFGLALRGALVWTGDTRPIPEVLAIHAGHGEPVAHDAGLVGNPSHTGLDDIEREYPPMLRERLWLYHYGSAAEGAALRARGARVMAPGQRLPLPDPLPISLEAG